MRRIFTCICTGVALAGCDLESGAGGGPVLNSPAVMEIVGGGDQVAKAGATLPAAVIARVSDSRKEPVRGVTVTFEVTVGEGSVSATTVKTDAGGNAQVD